MVGNVTITGTASGNGKFNTADQGAELGVPTLVSRLSLAGGLPVDSTPGNWALVDAGAILTVASPESSIVASGTYRLERSAGSAGAYID